MSFIKIPSRLANLKYSLLVLSLILIIPFTLLPIISSPHFPIISEAWAATYYVDATNGNDGYDGLSEAIPWKTIAKVNGSKFNPGDQILFKRGEIWREQLTVPSSGTAGAPITFGAYGTGADPIINGADLVTPWSLFSRNIYRAPLATECKRVFHGATELTLNEGSYASLGNNQWDWDSNYLYVNIGQDPTGETIEATKRTNDLNLNGKNYITIDGLHITKANQDGLDQWTSASNYITIENCIIDYNGYSGIVIQSGTGGSNWLIQNNTFSYNGTTTMHHGIYANTLSNSTIENNIFNTNKGWAISIGDNSDSNIVRYNYSTGHTAAGKGFLAIWDNAVNTSDNYQIYYNISNGDRIGIQLGGMAQSGHKVYNNTFYTTYSGIAAADGACFAEVENNIFWGSPNPLHLGAASTITTSSDYNDLGPEGTYFIGYNDHWYSTLADYQSSESRDAHSIKSDPKFVSTSDFHLQSTSPCIDAGTTVGLNEDIKGTPVPQGKGPDIGAFEYKIISPPKNLKLYTIFSLGN